MRLLVALTLMVAPAVLAQRNTFGSEHGFGNVVFPGMGHAPRNPNLSGFGNVVFPGGGRASTHPLSITDPSFASRLGRTVGAFPYRRSEGGFQRGAAFVPFAYPVYVGSYYPYPEPQPQPQPSVVVVYPPQPAPQPIVIQTAPAPAPERERETITHYRAPSSADSGPAEPSYYLIAFKDNTIYSAVAYYVAGDTLHYFTNGNVHNQVSLALVDREMTERLNRDRKVSVKLP